MADASKQIGMKLLAKTAETELQTCRLRQPKQMQTGDSIAAEAHLVAGQETTQSVAEGHKQLREARLEVMRDRKLALEVSESSPRSAWPDRCLSGRKPAGVRAALRACTPPTGKSQCGAPSMSSTSAFVSSGAGMPNYRG